MSLHQTKPGIDVLLKDRKDVISGRRIGLITNQTGISASSKWTADLLKNQFGAELVALFAPEHGIRGMAQAGEFVPSSFDAHLGIPVYSLYGQSQRNDPENKRTLDEVMREFDTTNSEKSPIPSMIEGLDTLVFDIQDVGTRIYTYLATMAYCMQAAAKADKEYVVLDRPNPITGIRMEGPVLEYPAYSTFVGLYPIPVRHGMTLGELARFFNENYLEPKARLTVIPMSDWKRTMWFDETFLKWVPPSPNMPTLSTATVYPGQVYLEGTNISEGRGTTHPFEIFGAPWMEGRVLSGALNRLDLAGAGFDAVEFTPSFSKYRGERCSGCLLHVRDRNRYAPFKTSLHILETVQHMYPDNFLFHNAYFDCIMGTETVRKKLEISVPVDRIVESYQKPLEEFELMRKAYLLY